MNQISVMPEQVKVAEGNLRMVAAGVSSSIVICLYERERKIGGMLHAVLPGNLDFCGRSARFVQAGLDILLAQLKEFGAHPYALLAKIVGGAKLFSVGAKSKDIHVGKKNILSAREALERQQIKIIGEDVGGRYGRTVHFNLEDGMVTIFSAEQFCSVI